MYRKAGEHVRWLLATALLSCGSIAAVSSQATAAVARSTVPRVGGVLNIVSANNWSTLDPASPLGAQATGQLYFSAIYSGLFLPGPNGTFVPGLASGWTISPNKKIFIIHLRKGVKFQDGSPFNAAAVAWNIRRDAAPATGCLCQPELADVTSVTTPNNYEVAVYLSQPFAAIVATFASTGAAYMVSPRAFESEGATAFGIHPIGAGPFMVTSNDVGVSLQLKRFGGYWDHPEPYLSAVNYTVESTTFSAYAAFQSGAAQLDVDTDPPTLGEAHSDSAATIETTSQTTSQFVQINSEKAPFNSLAARQALAYATDFEPINKSIFGGTYTPTESLIPPGDVAYGGKTVPGYLAYNPAKAGSLAASAGGVPFALQFNAATAITTSFAEALDQEWTAAGLHATLDPLSRTQYVANQEDGQYQAILQNFSGPDPAPAMANYFLSTGELNNGLSNPRVNALLAQGENNYSPTARAATYLKLMSYMDSNALEVPLEVESVSFILDKTVKGIPAGLPGEWLNGAWIS